jgi:hypothetical protein
MTTDDYICAAIVSFVPIYSLVIVPWFLCRFCTRTPQ